MPFKMPDFSKVPNFFDRFPRFSEQLRDQRTLRGLTVEELAAATGLAPSAIRDIEAGKRAAPSEQVAKALADALHLTGDERDSFVDAADLESPVVSTFFGRERPKTPGRPQLTAAILVFLIADIRGYTHFTREQGDDAAARLTTRFAELGHAVMERWDGQLVEARGDEILGVFASARQALQAAQELQARYVEEAHAHPELPAGIGIGLDIGEAVQVDEGYRGMALNRAARLCSLAGPGEVLVSPGVVYVAPQVEGMRFVPRGQEQLKGFDEPMPILLAAPSPVVDMSEDPAPDA
jgi:class 3 adenylate cyclase